MIALLFRARLHERHSLTMSKMIRRALIPYAILIAGLFGTSGWASLWPSTAPAWLIAFHSRAIWSLLTAASTPVLLGQSIHVHSNVLRRTFGGW